MLSKQARDVLELVVGLGLILIALLLPVGCSAPTAPQARACQATLPRADGTRICLDSLRYTP